MLQTVLDSTKLSSLSRYNIDCGLYQLHSGTSFFERAYLQLAANFAKAKLTGLHRADGDADRLSGKCTNLKVLTSELTIQKVHGVELSGGSNTVDFRRKLIDLKLDLVTILGRVGVVSCLGSQFVHSLEHGVNFVQCTFSCLYYGDTILCVGGCTVKTANLASHLFGDCQTCCIICCTVDLVAARKLLSGLCLLTSYETELTIGVHCLHIVLYYHNSFLLECDAASLQHSW